MSDTIYHAPGPRRSWAVSPKTLRFAGAGLLIGMLLALGVALFCSPWVWYGSRDGYQQHRALTFTMPPEQVVYEEDPARAARLLALPADPRTAYVGGPRRYSPLPFEVPAGDYRPCGRGGTCAEYVP